MAKYYGLRHVYLDNQTPIKPIPASLKEYPWIIRKIQTGEASSNVAAVAGMGALAAAMGLGFAELKRRH